MRNWKTTLAGFIAGLPLAIDALSEADKAGFFTGKSGMELVVAIGIILFGVWAKDHNVTGGVKVILLVACMGAFSSSQAQSFFKPIPKKATPMRFLQVWNDSVTTSPVATTMTAFRPVLNAVTYSEPDHLAMAGVGVSYQWLKYNATTQKWESTFAVNALFYGGAGLASPNQGAYAFGPSVSFFNGFLSIGGAYNFVTKKLGPTLGINVQLNN